jgi:error-prone DNA polymerase
MSRLEETLADYRDTGLTTGPQIVAHLRPALDAEGVLRACDLAGVPNGRWVKVAGLVIVRQRPGTASGVIFMTLEDETGITNLIVWPRTFERFRRAVLGARLLVVSGRLQREGLVLHLIAEQLIDRTDLLLTLNTAHHPSTALAPESADHVQRPERELRPTYPSRDFH